MEYTVPEVSQSLIITRLEGRTPVPAREQLEAFASHQTSMAIYLSVQRIHRVAERLVEGGYPATTPVAVIYKATRRKARPSAVPSRTSATKYATPGSAKRR